jgi:hypothetical protein
VVLTFVGGWHADFPPERRIDFSRDAPTTTLTQFLPLITHVLHILSFCKLEDLFAIMLTACSPIFTGLFDGEWQTFWVGGLKDSGSVGAKQARYDWPTETF